MYTIEEMRELSLIILQGGLILIAPAIIGVLSALLGSYLITL